MPRPSEVLDREDTLNADDPLWHVYCQRCQTGMAEGDVSLCGHRRKRDAVWCGQSVGRKCVVCVDLIDAPCLRCGARN